jgi:hypothetical protein
MRAPLRALWWISVLVFLGWAVSLPAQGSLSEQVLRLLTRDNTWSGINIFGQSVGIELERASVAVADPTDRLENRGGNLYFNNVLVATSAGAGTVTSVALTLPNIFSVSGSPITSSGTLAASLATQTANRVWAGPTSGSAATPTFRALVAADIPDISATYLTASSTATLTNKSGAISQWTNDSGYITSASVGTNITTVGTVTTGTWNATVVTGQYGGTGVANTGKTITLGGNFTTSGANAVTLTTSGATNVTLPTTGTLATTAATTLSSLASIGTITTGVWNGTAVGVVYGGTGLTSATQGDLLYASAANTLAVLAKNTTATRYLSNTGSSNNPAWAQINLANGVTGTLPAANGGTAVTTTPTSGQLLIGDGAGYTLATITGTADQITVTNGVGSITLATPQGINTTSTPQFARLGLGTAAGATAVLTTTGQVNLGIYDVGNCGAAATINFNNGQVQKTLLNAATCTLTFTNPISGAVTYELQISQDATGSRLITWPGTILWEGAGAPTLSTGANDIDYCSFKWNGTSYLGSCKLGFD